MTIGERIKNHLDRFAITQVQFAKDVGVTQQCISDWIKGQRPHKKWIQKLSQVLGIEIEKLTTGE